MTFANIWSTGRLNMNECAVNVQKNGILDPKRKKLRKKKKTDRSKNTKSPLTGNPFSAHKKKKRRKSISTGNLFGYI